MLDSLKMSLVYPAVNSQQSCGDLAFTSSEHADGCISGDKMVCPRGVPD